MSKRCQTDREDICVMNTGSWSLLTQSKLKPRVEILPLGKPLEILPFTSEKTDLHYHFESLSLMYKKPFVLFKAISFPHGLPSEMGLPLGKGRTHATKATISPLFNFLQSRICPCIKLAMFLVLLMPPGAAILFRWPAGGTIHTVLPADLMGHQALCVPKALNRSFVSKNIREQKSIGFLFMPHKHEVIIESQT